MFFEEYIERAEDRGLSCTIWPHKAGIAVQLKLLINKTAEIFDSEFLDLHFSGAVVVSKLLA